MPLPFHNGVWVPHVLVPFFWDNCLYGPNPCLFMDYMQFTFDNQEWIYSAKNMTPNQIIQKWTTQVAEKFSLNQTELSDLFDRKNPHNAYYRTVYMYKYNVQKNAAGTPQGRVNGIVIENYPETTDQWFDILNTVY